MYESLSLLIRAPAWPDDEKLSIRHRM